MPTDPAWSYHGDFRYGAARAMPTRCLALASTVKGAPRIALPAPHEQAAADLVAANQAKGLRLIRAVLFASAQGATLPS